MYTWNDDAIEVEATKVDKKDIPLWIQEELKLKSLSEVTHPDDIETSRLEGEKLYTKQKIQIEIEKRYIHSDGSIKWGKLHAKLIFNSEGKPIYFTLCL